MDVYEVTVNEGDPFPIQASSLLEALREAVARVKWLNNDSASASIRVDRR